MHRDVMVLAMLAPWTVIANGRSPSIETMPGTQSRTLVVKAALQASATAFAIEYTVENRSDEEAYLLDVTRTGADLAITPIYVAWLGGDRAHLVQGIAPLPPDRDVNVSVIPLGERIAPHARITRHVTLPRPLAEFGPYDPPAPASNADVRGVCELVITVAALRPSAKGFRRELVTGETYVVASDYTVGHVQRASTIVALPERSMLRTFRFSGTPTFTRFR
jgi:hypothetical protein